MFKRSIIVILTILTIIVAISGCTTKTAANGTFGEKDISLNSITISNNTTADHDNYNGTEYYIIDGYLINNNKYDAFHVKLNATVYDTYGNVVATNDSAYLESNSIPANGVSYFFVDFPDPNKKIVRYEVKLVDAKGSI